MLCDDPEEWDGIAVKHRESNLVLCDDPEEWDGWEEGGCKRRGYIYITVTDLYCCTAENQHNIVKQFSTN